MTLRTFILHGDEQLRNCHSYIEACFRETKAGGNPIEVKVDEHDPKRTTDQNALYWTLLTAISERGVDDDGRHHPKEWWAYKLRVELGYVNGTIELKAGPGFRIEAPYPKSTTLMGKREFSELYTKIEVWAAERGIYLDAGA